MRNNALRFLFLGFLCLFSDIANATCSAAPFIFTLGATILPSEVNSDFAALVTCINTVDAAQITTGILPVARGGTGASTSTGSGSVMLAASPTTTGTLTAGAVIASGTIRFSAYGAGALSADVSGNVAAGTLAVTNGGTGTTTSTGTGSAVLSASPTLTGTLAGVASNWSGNVGVAGSGAPSGLVNLAIVGNTTGIQGGASSMNLIAGGVTRFSVGTNVSTVGDFNVTSGIYRINGTNGVNCSGTPSVGFTVSGGIVTAC